MIKIFLLSTGLFLLANITEAQQKYWIYFKDSGPENTSSVSIENLSENSQSILRLKEIGVDPIVHSKWLNAISAVLHESQIDQIRSYDFVKEIVVIDRNLKVLSYQATEAFSFTKALQQIQADTLLLMGLNGEGVKIGIIDGGFLDADKLRSLEFIIGNKKVKAYKNFIETDIDDPYTGARQNRDNHGTQVWQAIGGQEERNHYRGLATHAEYYLARTDQGDKEYRGEEDYWVGALEWMHEQGVKLVNSSLGYSNGYDDPNENYSRSHVDGQSSAITRVATLAAQEKGMLIVIAGGNDGNNDFEIISIPADAKGVLSVGATAFRQWSKAGYSSIGPEQLEDIKPEVACYSFTGTSFSAPIITGLAACIWQAYPDLTNKEIINYIEKSSHLSKVPNNYLGYGVPDVKRLLKLINNQPGQVEFLEERTSKDIVYLNFSDEDNIVAFHKKDDRIVIKQEVIRPKREVVIIQRIDNAVRTTVATPDKVVEIFWED